MAKCLARGLLLSVRAPSFSTDMTPKVTISKSGPGVDKIRAALEKLREAAVLVGIPQATTGRRGEPINNASLLYILSNGSPARGIPATPVIEPAIMADGNRQIIGKELAAAASAQLSDDGNAAVLHFKRAGTAGTNAAKGWFTDARNAWPPNKPSTIRRKGSDRRNIDTGALRAAMTYVLVNMPAQTSPAKKVSNVAESAVETIAEVVE